MKITWYGQASFGLESDSGLLIVTDPYDPKTSGFREASFTLKETCTDLSCRTTAECCASVKPITILLRVGLRIASKLLACKIERSQ